TVCRGRAERRSRIGVDLYVSAEVLSTRFVSDGQTILIEPGGSQIGLYAVRGAVLRTAFADYECQATSCIALVADGKNIVTGTLGDDTPVLYDYAREKKVATACSS